MEPETHVQLNQSTTHFSNTKGSTLCTNGSIKQATDCFLLIRDILASNAYIRVLSAPHLNPGHEFVQLRPPFPISHFPSLVNFCFIEGAAFTCISSS